MKSKMQKSKKPSKGRENKEEAPKAGDSGAKKLVQSPTKMETVPEKSNPQTTRPMKPSPGPTLVPKMKPNAKTAYLLKLGYTKNQIEAMSAKKSPPKQPPKPSYSFQNRRKILQETSTLLSHSPTAQSL